MKEHFELFNGTDQVIVHNPTKENFVFSVGGERNYEVNAGQFKLLHGTAARLYVKKMCDAHHIQENRTTDLNNANAEAETAKLFVKSVVDDDTDLDEAAIADLVKSTKAVDTPKPKREPTKEETQKANVKHSDDADKSPVKEAEFPDAKKDTTENSQKSN